MVNRIPSAFQNIHRASTLNSMFKSNMTDPKLLERRAQVLNPNVGRKVEVFGKVGSEEVTMIRPTFVYRDYTSTIAEVCGFSDGSARRQRRSVEVICHSPIVCIDVETDEEVLICAEGGMIGPTRIATMWTKFGTFLLYATQCMYPKLHVDRCMLLPSSIRNEMFSIRGKYRSEHW